MKSNEIRNNLGSCCKLDQFHSDASGFVEVEWVGVLVGAEVGVLHYISSRDRFISKRIEKVNKFISVILIH